MLHVGRDQEADFYYYVMELADDQSGLEIDQIDPTTYQARTLTADLKQHRVRDISECIALGTSLAEALAHLHQSGLTHRDVKPSNIIFVKGDPRLADIGLVARTGQRTYVGTEGYVPPEGPGTSSADLYSLAMVLYEMHTGKDRLDFPELPTNHELGPTVNRDEWRALNTVICRAGAPDPRKRFETGLAFSKALRRIRPGDFPDVRNAAPDQKGHWLPNKLLFTSSIVGLCLTILVLGIVFWKTMMSGDDPVEPEEKDPIDLAEFTPVEVPPKEPTPAPEIVPEEKPEPPPAIVAEVVPNGSIKLDSWPSGATVWMDGKEIGRTPTPYREFPPGEHEFLFRKAGYLDETESRTIEPGESLLLRAELDQDRRPRNGQRWTNSQSLRFTPLPEGSFFAPVTSTAYENFLTETGRPFVMSAKDGVVLVSDPKSKWAFCDWMTKKDRGSGFLDETQFHAPVPRQPGDHSLYSYLGDSFNQILITSEPAGATVFEGEKPLGNAPLTIKRRQGPYELYVVMPGYQEASFNGTLSGSDISIPVALSRDQSVVFGERWRNSLNAPMVPVGDLMVSCWETRLRDFAEFIANNGNDPSLYTPEFIQTPDDPVVNISREDANSFCRWLTQKEQGLKLIRPSQTYRLPTDLEWSQLAGLTSETGNSPQARERAGYGTFPWGDQWPPTSGVGNYADETGASTFGKYLINNYRDDYIFTSPVGSFTANENEIFDVGGNVWEWVSDDYDVSAKNLGVVRGGGWDSYEREVLLTSFRNAVSPTDRNERYGFRYVLSDSQK